MGLCPSRPRPACGSRTRRARSAAARATSRCAAAPTRCTGCRGRSPSCAAAAAACGARTRGLRPSRSACTTPATTRPTRRSPCGAACSARRCGACGSTGPARSCRPSRRGARWRSAARRARSSRRWRRAAGAGLGHRAPRRRPARRRATSGLRGASSARSRTAPAPDEPLDLVTASHAFEHLHEPVAAFAKLRAWSKDDGWLTCAVPDSSTALFSRFAAGWYDLDLPRHLFHFTPASLTAALARCGWRVERITWPGDAGRRDLAGHARQRAHEERLEAPRPRALRLPRLLAARARERVAARDARRSDRSVRAHGRLGPRALGRFPNGAGRPGHLT